MGKSTQRSGIKKLTDELKLKQHESLLIFRRRKGWNQGEMAQKLGVSHHEYKLLEYGLTSIAFTIPANSKYVSWVNIAELLPHEKCLIYRKRAKISQAEVAKEMGISRTWLRMQETGEVDCAPLLRFWTK